MPYSPPWVEPGWPNLPDQGMAMVSAFNAGQQISAKRQQLENQLAAMAIRQQNMELMAGLREAEFNRRLEQGNQRLEIEQQTANLKDLIHQDAQNKLVNATEGTANLLNAEAQLADEGIKPGDKNFEAEYLRRIANTGAPNSVINAARRTQLMNHFAVTKNKEKELEANLKEFRERYGAEVLGNPRLQDVSILSDPSKLPDQVTNKGSWWSPKYEPTGNKLVPTFDYTGKPTTKPVSTQVLQKFKSEYESILKKKDDIPIIQDHPDMGVYAKPAGTLREKALRYRDDPNIGEATKAAAEKWLRENPE